MTRFRKSVLVAGLIAGVLLSGPASAENVGFILTWDKSEGASRYVVRWRILPDAWKPTKSVNTERFEVTENMGHDKTIRFAVRGCNEAGCGAWSQEVGYTHKIVKPGKVQNLVLKLR